MIEKPIVWQFRLKKPGIWEFLKTKKEKPIIKKKKT